MSKLEEIKKVLSTDPNITWNEQSARLPYPRRGKGFYYSIGFRVAPKEPIPDARDFQEFSKRLMKELTPIGPSSISRCYEFPGVKREIVRIGTLYYSENVKDLGEQNEIERRIAVSIYPCHTMAEVTGFRGLIELKRFQCPHPCKVAKKCAYKAPKRRGLDIG